jgi:hypothetical protein
MRKRDQSFEAEMRALTAQMRALPPGITSEDVDGARNAAASMRLMFSVYREAGFTEDQSLALLINFINQAGGQS